MSDEIQKVRPLGEDGQSGAAPSPPRMALLIAVLAIGSVVGWGLSALGGGFAGNDSDTAASLIPETSSAALTEPEPEPEPEPVLSVNWTRATSVPEFPAGYDYAGATHPVEFDGSLYLVVRFSLPSTGDIRNEIWISTDGQTWHREILDLGDGVTIYDLASTPRGLILSAYGSQPFAMWRSVPGTPIDGTSWELMDVTVPAGIDVVYHTTTVNEAGAVVTTVIGTSDIWREIVAPLVPDDVDPEDPRLSLAMSSLYLQGETARTQLFINEPEVVTTEDSIWVRAFTIGGEEILRVFDLPEGVYPAERSPDLGRVQVSLSWFSTDGDEFLPVLGPNAVPDGYFLPEPWGDGFIAAGYEMESSFAQFEDIRLWSTASGRAWQPLDTQPPSGCTSFFTASTGRLILLASDTGSHCLGTLQGEWTVLDDVELSGYVVAGPAGFIAYPDGFAYDSTLFSPDGETWTSIEVPAAEPYPTLVPLQDRLFMLSVDPARRSVPAHIELWLGEIE